MNNLPELTKLVRYHILTMTTKARSGHATSSLSAVELMTTLFFKYLRFDLNHPENINNDRVIFSKGHASPLFYALYKVAGVITEKELLGYRTFNSTLEGHPTMRFPFTEAPTGSLGQGLSVGVGEALALQARISNNPINASRVFVLLGDGETSEGQIWEAIEIAAFYKLNNLIALVDFNRLGQSQQTLLGVDIGSLARRVASFGWRTYIVENGHDLELLDKAYSLCIKQSQDSDKPAMILAKTVKGKGISFWEDKNGYHGVVLKQDELKIALKELGKIETSLIAKIQKPSVNYSQEKFSCSATRSDTTHPAIKSSASLECELRKFSIAHNNKIKALLRTSNYELPACQRFTAQPMAGRRTNVSTRKAFGEALVKLGEIDSNLVVMDADVQNSTYTNLFAKKNPDRFYQMFIAEQNMVSVALGLAKMGLVPVVSTFASFLTRTSDQIRMAHLAGSHIIFNGSHGGVSVGPDGPSQMGLEDISLFRTLPNSTVLYPADAVATEKLLIEACNLPGIVYLRTQRPETPVIYGKDEMFPIGGSHVFYSSNPTLRRVRSYQLNSSHPAKQNSNNKIITIIACGITVIESLKAQKELLKQKIAADVIDCYSIKPIDVQVLKKAAEQSKFIITVEDHYTTGGLGDAVLEALADIKHPPIYKLGITKTPRSGTKEELFDYEGISDKEIVKIIRREDSKN